MTSNLIVPLELLFLPHQRKLALVRLFNQSELVSIRENGLLGRSVTTVLAHDNGKVLSQVFRAILDQLVEISSNSYSIAGKDEDTDDRVVL